jgi:hypothetical protein
MKTQKQSKLAAMPRTRAEWRGWMLHDMAFAEARLRKIGSVIQTFVLHGIDGQKVILAAPFTSGAQRDGVLKFLKAVCIAHQAAGFSCITEAWVGMAADQAEVEALDRGEGLRVSERETRREVISVMLIYRDSAGQRQALGMLREIVRGADGKATGVTPMADIPDDDAEVNPDFGGIPHILSAETPDRLEVKSARDLLRDIGPKLMEVLGIGRQS